MLSAALVKWAFSLTAAKPAGEEIIVINEFIQDHFGFLSLREIVRAKDLSLTGKLSIDTSTYGKFTIQYVGAILSAYVAEVRNHLLKKVALELEKKNQGYQWTPEDKLKSHQQYIWTLYQAHKKEGFFLDIDDLLYKMLKKHKLFRPTDEQKKLAEQLGEKRARALMKDQGSAVVKQFLEQDLEKLKIRFAKETFIRMWFDSFQGEEKLVDFIEKKVPEFYKSELT